MPGKPTNRKKRASVARRIAEERRREWNRIKLTRDYVYRSQIGTFFDCIPPGAILDPGKPGERPYFVLPNGARLSRAFYRTDPDYAELEALFQAVRISPEIERMTE